MLLDLQVGLIENEVAFDEIGLDFYLLDHVQVLDHHFDQKPPLVEVHVEDDLVGTHEDELPHELHLLPPITVVHFDVEQREFLPDFLDFGKDLFFGEFQVLMQEAPF